MSINRREKIRYDKKEVKAAPPRIKTHSAFFPFPSPIVTQNRKVKKKNVVRR